MDEILRAKVEDREITLEDIQKFINMLPVEQQSNFNTEDGLNKICDEMINQQLIYLEAIDKNLDKEEDFLIQLAIDKENLLKQYALSKILSNIEVSEDDLIKYYDSHKDYFISPMQITASHILVDDLEKAQSIKNQLDAGKDFEELARSESKCPSSEQAGNLGTFKPGDMVKEFDDVVKTIKVGEISEPVKTQFGYHIIKVFSREDGKHLAFEEIKGELRKQFMALKQQEAYINKTKDLMKKYQVEKFY